MQFVINLEDAVDFAAQIAPDLPIADGVGAGFFSWADGVTELLSYIYGQSYDSTLELLVKAVKKHQNYEDPEESDED